MVFFSMPGDDAVQSLSGLVAARRSRSERLSSLAKEQGLEERDGPEESVASNEPREDEAHAAKLSADDAEQDDAEQMGAEAALEQIAESPSEATEPTAASDEEASVDETENGLLDIEDELTAEDETIAGPDEDEALAPEELIARSDSLLSDEPASLDEAEARMEAEALVDRIGPIVDIQNLPKTQPSRVLSKTEKAVEEAKTAKPEASDPTSAEPPQALASMDGLVEGAPESGSKPGEPPEAGKAKKKKRISLLDSYFKGL